LDLAPVTHIDTTALHVLDDMCKTQARLGTQMCFCNPSIAVMIKLIKSGLVDVVGRHRIFPAVSDAVHWCLLDMDSKEDVSAVLPPASVDQLESAAAQEESNESAVAQEEGNVESGAITQEDSKV
jgi:STAS domain